MNIAIYTRDFNWAGGIDLLHGIVKGLLAEKKVKKNIFMLIHDPTIKQPFNGILKDKVKTFVRASLNPTHFFSILFRKNFFLDKKEDFDPSSYIVEIFAEEEVSLIFYNEAHPQGRENALALIQADIILPVLFSRFPKDAKVPYIGYMFDFVYKHHSYLYTSKFCLETDIKYATTLLNSKSIVVNSKDVYKDIQLFFPYSETKVFVMPFAPYTNTKVYQKALEKADIKNNYRIEKKYFIISNQFWLHKSHEIAFKALAILHKILGNEDVCLVCTGKMSDLSGTNERKDQLYKYAAELGLSKYIFFLGHITKVDQLALMLRSEGVLQPTSFEGGPGGGSVYMAVANGVPAIISDIPVNKEIEDEPLVTFFKLHDATDLATKMYEQMQKGFPLLTPIVVEEKNEQRQILLGSQLMDCINYTIDASQKNFIN